MLNSGAMTLVKYNVWIITRGHDSMLNHASVSKFNAELRPVKLAESMILTCRLKLKQYADRSEGKVIV